jgi:hypothetical protein
MISSKVGNILIHPKLKDMKKKVKWEERTKYTKKILTMMYCKQNEMSVNGRDHVPYNSFQSLIFAALNFLAIIGLQDYLGTVPAYMPSHFMKWN